jgi:ATP-dependent RNA helicase RhlE
MRQNKKQNKVNFYDLDLSDNVLDALDDMRFEACTPIQEKCIPEILDGHDIIGVAQTGTGKTAAYLLPILSMLDDGKFPKDAINCVIMSPTRELAQQIDQAMQGFSYYLEDVSSVAVYGGNDGNRYEQERKGLSLGADVIIATPGRLISHLSLGNVDMGKVSFFVLDEADRMLDMGFSEDILQIKKYLPDSCQTIMFSATMPRKIQELAKSLLHDPVEVKLAVSKPAEKIRQSAYVCYENQKLGIIRTLFKDNKLKRVIIFSGSKQKVKEVQQSLVRAKINSGEMHSDLDQAQRDEIMYRFKSGQIDVLVATDIVARGIDIDDIQMVINYDVPRDAEDYVHRIGRTARADRDGEAITFISEREIGYFQQIEHFLEKEVEKTPIPANLGDGPKYEAQPKKFGEHHSHGKSNKGNGRNKSGNRGNNNQNKSENGNKKRENAINEENRIPKNNGNRGRNSNHRADNKNQNHTSIKKTYEKREDTTVPTNKVVE